MRTVISLVAPSPSCAILRARARATSSTASSSCFDSAEPAAMGGLPAAPLASSRKESLVELSPSTVTWLKLRSAIGLTAAAAQPGSTAASVTT